MDWDTYKDTCDRPAVLSRWMLEQTAELVVDDAQLHDALTAVIREAAPLERPTDHRGGPATDMFVVSLSVQLADRLQCRVENAVDAGARTDGTRARGLGGFVEAWREYAASVRGDGCESSYR